MTAKPLMALPSNVLLAKKAPNSIIVTIVFNVDPTVNHVPPKINAINAKITITL